MFKGIFVRKPKEDRRSKPCAGDAACDAHPLRRDEDYRRAVEGGIAQIRENATAAAEGLNEVAARLAKQRCA